MKKKLFLFLIPLCATMILAPTITFAVAGETPTVIDDTTFDDDYSVNSTINFPSTSNTYFKKNDGSISKATYAEITFPDGQVRTPGNYILNMAGKYSVKYFDSANSFFSKDFVVNKFVHEIGKGGNVSFQDSMPLSKAKGINLTLTSGVAFRLNKVINLSSFPDGLIDIYTMYPYFREDKKDTPKVDYVSLKLLDAYDTSRFVEFYIWCGSSEPGPYYVGAGASTQNLTGCENNPNKPERNNVIYEGTPLYKHNVSRYQSVDAYGNWENYGCNSDVINKGGAKATWNFSNGKVFTSTGLFVTDLDSIEIYGKEAINLNEFFTNGDVIPQIECFGYHEATMNIEIASLCGISGDNLKDYMIEDDTNPTIVNPYSSEEITIFKGKKFYIPTDIKAYDLNYHDYLKASVYYNYKQVDQIKIESTDYFIPTRVGKYTIEYKAKDAYGNESTSVITLNSVDKAPFIYTQTKVNELFGATLNVIPKLDVVSSNKGLEVKCFAKSPLGVKEELTLTDQGYSLIPLCLGEYEIEYQIKDKYYEETFSYKVNSVDNNNIYFINTPPVYPYYIKDAEYSVDEFTGIKATLNGPEIVDTVPYVSFDGGEYVQVDASNKFKVTGNNTLQLKFVKDNFSIESRVVNIVDIAFGQKTLARNYSKYFQGNYASATDTSAKDPSTGKYPNQMVYTFNQAGSMEFVNLISASDFSFSFIENLKAGESMSVKLTDYVDDNNYIQLDIKKVDGGNHLISLVQYSNKELVSVSNPFYSENLVNNFAFVMNNKKANLSSDTTNILSNIDLVPQFELSRLEISTTSSIDIVVSKLNGVTFAGSNSMFEAVPTAALKKDVTSITLGEDYILLPCIPSCVLSPVLNENVKLDVLLPNGEFAKDKEGNVLNNVDGLKTYVLNLSSAGQYKVSYSITANGSNAKGPIVLDSKNGAKEIGFILNVDDTIAPVVNFDNAADLKIKVGDRIKIRSFTATDNITPKEKLVTKIMVVDTSYTILENGYDVSEYTFRKVGNYKVCVLVIDEAGNQSLASYNVVVEA